MTGPAPATQPARVLQDLIRIDTTNPPGNETECVVHLQQLLRHRDDLDVHVLGPESDRANLVVRFPGRGEAPPLLLHGHSDVVPVTDQAWSHRPFEAHEVDGEIWGRGAIDMKGGLSMMLAALSRLHEAGERPAGDVVWAVVADEEAGSRVGAGYLVEHHRELFDGVRYAIGEEGGAGVDLGGQRYHPIVVAEKRACWLRVRMHGPGGHGSRLTPVGTPMQRLGALLTALTGSRLPQHTEQVAQRMLETLAATLEEPLASGVRAVLAGDAALALQHGLPDEECRQLDSLLRNTVNPTIVRSSEKINMVPAEVSVDLDGRLLPGAHTVEEMVAEIEAVLGEPIDPELLLEGSRVWSDSIAEPEFGGFYHALREVTAAADPSGVPLPMMSPASTDARLFAQLGIRCYGWLPLDLPAGSDLRALLHRADERVPVAALEFGTRCLMDLLRRYR